MVMGGELSYFASGITNDAKNLGKNTDKTQLFGCQKCIPELVLLR